MIISASTEPDSYLEVIASCITHTDTIGNGTLLLVIFTTKLGSVVFTKTAESFQ